MFNCIILVLFSGFGINKYLLSLIFPSSILSIVNLVFNWAINSDNPKETVIFEDSYELKNARMSLEKLSKSKLNDLLNEYKRYQNKYGIDEQRIVHMTNVDILLLNPDLQEKIYSN